MPLSPTLQKHLEYERKKIRKTKNAQKLKPKNLGYISILRHKQVSRFNSTIVIVVIVTTTTTTTPPFALPYTTKNPSPSSSLDFTLVRKTKKCRKTKQNEKINVQLTTATAATTTCSKAGKSMQKKKGREQKAATLGCLPVSHLSSLLAQPVYFRSPSACNTAHMCMCMCS